MPAAHVLMCPHAELLGGGFCPDCEKQVTIAGMATKKASGVNIPEAQRSTVQVKLRLPDDVLEDLDALAERWGITRSGAVARMVAAQSEGEDSKGGV